MEHKIQNKRKKIPTEEIKVRKDLNESNKKKILINKQNNLQVYDKKYLHTFIKSKIWKCLKIINNDVRR